MIDKKNIKKYFTEEFEFYYKYGKIDSKNTPIFKELSYSVNNDKLELYIKNLKDQLDKDIEFGYVFINSMFITKQVPEYKITIGGNVYYSKNYKNPTQWILDFLSKEQISFTFLKKLNTKDRITFSKTEEELLKTTQGKRKQTQVKKLNTQKDCFYFNHKHWGLANFNKSTTNVNVGTGPKLLSKSLRDLARIIKKDIVFSQDGIRIEKTLLGKKLKVYYESNNSNL